jgi:hypothetical protein
MQFSIHPRSWPGGSREKRNTCNPRSHRKLERALAGIEKHLEQHPHDGVSAARVAKIKTILAS